MMDSHRIDRRLLASALRRRLSTARSRLRGLRAAEVAQLPEQALSDERPAGWWDLLPFSMHRITLAPGIDTSTTGFRAFNDVRCELVLEACGGSLDGRTVVDLGCLEGGFTLAFAQKGARHALGIEAREISVRRCELAKGLLGVANAEFVRADIKDELPRHQPFDVVFASGILYHVADPLQLLTDMRAACSLVALVDTHIADREDPSHGCSEPVTREFAGHRYEGRLHPEYPASFDSHAREELLLAAWSDAEAFWPFESDLIEMIHHAGFSSVDKIELGHVGLDRWGVDPINRVVYLAHV